MRLGGVVRKKERHKNPEERDISIPLDNGSVLIRAQFIAVDKNGAYIPELSIKFKNQTSDPWRAITVQFDLGGFCNGEGRQWSFPVTTSLGHGEVTEYEDTVSSLAGKVDGCKTEIVKARLVHAENFKTQIKGVSGERSDLQKELKLIKARREAEASRQRRLAAERKLNETERAARLARLRAEEGAKAAEERHKSRAACAVIYQNTIDKKVKDLTVREEQQVRACQTLDLYPPR
jgi:hypothetical protein